MDRPKAIVFAGGDHTAPFAVPSRDLVIAADSGYDAALAAGVVVDLLVGDLDSISDSGLAHAREHGVAIEAHPPDKDATDLELALRAAVERGVGSIVIVGGDGGRFDHLLGNTLLLAASFLAGVDVAWERGATAVQRVASGSPGHLHGVAGDTVSLLPVTERVAGVTTIGLRWPLQDAVLALGTSRGISNQLETADASVSVTSGVLLVVHERSNRS